MQRIRDRQFIVVDAAGKFVTARRYPRMVLIEATVARAGQGQRKSAGVRGMIGSWLGGGGGGGAGLALRLTAPEMTMLEVLLPEVKRQWEREEEEEDDQTNGGHDVNIDVQYDIVKRFALEL